MNKWKIHVVFKLWRVGRLFLKRLFGRSCWLRRTWENNYILLCLESFFFFFLNRDLDPSQLRGFLVTGWFFWGYRYLCLWITRLKKGKVRKTVENCKVACKYATFLCKATCVCWSSWELLSLTQTAVWKCVSGPHSLQTGSLIASVGSNRHSEGSLKTGQMMTPRLIFQK